MSTGQQGEISELRDQIASKDADIKRLKEKERSLTLLVCLRKFASCVHEVLMALELIDGISNRTVLVIVARYDMFGVLEFVVLPSEVVKVMLVGTQVEAGVTS